jgi:hypothetical protein
MVAWRSWTMIRSAVGRGQPATDDEARSEKSWNGDARDAAVAVLIAVGMAPEAAERAADASAARQAEKVDPP